MNLRERCKILLSDWGWVDRHGIWSTRRDFENQTTDLEDFAREMFNAGFAQAKSKACFCMDNQEPDTATLAAKDPARVDDRA